MHTNMFHVQSKICKIYKKQCIPSPIRFCINRLWPLPHKGTLFKAFTVLCIIDAWSMSFCIAFVLSYCHWCSLCAICFMTCCTLMATWTCHQGKVWDIALVQQGCKSAPCFCLCSASTSHWWIGFVRLIST